MYDDGNGDTDSCYHIPMIMVVAIKINYDYGNVYGDVGCYNPNDDNAGNDSTCNRWRWQI